MTRPIAFFIFLLGMVVGAAGARLAFWRHPHHPPRPEDVAIRMARDLSLDDSQRARLIEIFAGFNVKMAAFQKDARRNFDALREENDANIEAILTTPEQKRRFAEMRRRWREGFPKPDHEEGPGMPPPPPGPPPQP